MSVRHSLLAILGQGACYGHQLRHEFSRRTGAIWPLNVGQIYNTLERLERDGLVARGTVDDLGHVYWEITQSGADEVARWLLSPVERDKPPRDEVAVKIAIASTLPGADSRAIIATQRQASRDKLTQLKERNAHDDGTAEGLARTLVTDSMIFAAEAELRWLDAVESRIAVHADQDLALMLASERPKRGRPARTDTSA